MAKNITQNRYNCVYAFVHTEDNVPELMVSNFFCFFFSVALNQLLVKSVTLLKHTDSFDQRNWCYLT